MKNKIGMAIITCNREHLFKECIKNLPEINSLIIVNDGKPYENILYPNLITDVIQHKSNKGVGKSKNEAFRYLLGKGCDHIFIMEDDVKIINLNIFEKYIETSNVTGIKHFNFAYHGPLNKTHDGKPNPVKIVDYGNETRISLHNALYAAFSYFHKDTLNKVGLMDERFRNFYEHVDHTYQISLAGFHPSFFWFPDIHDSYNYIEDLDPFHNNSAIRRANLSYKIRLKYYDWLYRRKDFPLKTITNIEDVLKELERIRKQFGKNEGNIRLI